MINLLALETSSSNLSVAVCIREHPDQPATVIEKSENVGLKHSDLLKNFCRETLDKASVSLQDITHLAVSIGPGSFTGLRVGISFARALAQVRGLPLIGINTLDLIAETATQVIRGTENIREKKDIGDLLPTMIIVQESIGNEFFVGMFKLENGIFKKYYRVSTLEEIFSDISKESQCLLLGNAAQRVKDSLPSSLQAHCVNLNSITDLKLMIPQAKTLASLAMTKIESEHPNISYAWQDVIPFYCREPIAVERAQYRNLKSI